MKNPIDIAKKGYNKILRIDDIYQQLELVISKQSQLEKQLAIIAEETSKIEHVDKQINEIKNLISTESKSNELRFNALYRHPDETLDDTNRRFLKNLPPAEGAIRTFQLGNAKLLKNLISICKNHHLPYFIQSGTLLGAVRHKGFVPWDDDTDIAMFRNDIETLRQILADNKNYKITLVYDYCVKSRQIRFRTADPANPCFIDIYIYDYSNDDSDAAWSAWQNTKLKIDSDFEKEDPAIILKWREEVLVDSDSELGKKLEPLFKKHYDRLLDSSTNKDNYTVAAWALDNFPVKWKRLFKKDFIFPVKQLTFEGIKVAAPKEYDEYLKRQYGNIYELPQDLVTHYQHIDHDDINTIAIEKYLSGKN